MSPRLVQSLRYVSGQFAATRDGFRQAMGGPAGGADMLLDGLMSSGLVNRDGDRIAVNDNGLRALAMHEAA